MHKFEKIFECLILLFLKFIFNQLINKLKQKRQKAKKA